MFDLNAIAGVSQQPDPTQPGAAPAQELGRDAFLKLLTTQMRNQDPTNPVQNEEFVAQLAQFSTVEQQMAMNDTLNDVLLGINAMNNASMASLLGTEVSAVGDGLSWDGQAPVELNWESAGSASSGTVSVLDADGAVVARLDTGAFDAGENALTWDGLGLDGQPVEPGTYRFVVNAKDAEGEAVAVETRVRGTVTGMDYRGGVPRPSIGGVEVGIGDILELGAADEPEPPDPLEPADDPA